MKRTAKEDDLTSNRATTCQASNALSGDSLQDRSSQIFVAGSLVNEGLKVGLGKNTTARGDRMDGLGPGCEVIEAGSVGVQQGSHLVDEGTGATSTRTIHALFGDRLEVGDLGILTTEFEKHVGVGIPTLDGGRLSHDLLNESKAQCLCGSQSRRSGNGRAHLCAGKSIGGVAEQRGHSAGDIGVVASVVLEKDVLVGIEDDGLDRR